MKTGDCQLNIIKRCREESLDVSDRLKGNLLVNLGLDEETAVEEAKRCLVNIRCESCNLCRLFCPDLRITRDKNSGEIEIDYDFCKGCGICAFVCPKGAIKMVVA